MTQITVNSAQQINQLPALYVGQVGERLAADCTRQVEDASENRARLFSQDQPAGPAVARIRSALDPAILLHAIELTHQGHRLDLEQIGKTGLIDPFVAGKVAQHAALRPGKSKKQQRPLVEASREQAGHIMHEITEAAFEFHSHAGLTKNYPKVIISYDTENTSAATCLDRAAGRSEFDSSLLRTQLARRLRALTATGAARVCRGGRTTSNTGIIAITMIIIEVKTSI